MPDVPDVPDVPDETLIPDERSARTPAEAVAEEAARRGVPPVRRLGWVPPDEIDRQIAAARAAAIAKATAEYEADAEVEPKA